MEAEIELLEGKICDLKIENEKLRSHVDYFLKSRKSVQREISNLKRVNKSLTEQVLNLQSEKRKSDFVDLIKSTEKIHNAENEIKYLFFEKKGSDKLIVTFPGFTDVGSFKYRYVRTLKDVNAHRLFLLDNFGTRGCYLLGQNRNFSVEKSVMSLIDTIIKKYDIDIKDVILQGSSKGGWMALYYGIKYRFGHVIAGAPQTKLGDFLLKHEVQIPSDGKIHPGSKMSVAEYISGGHEEEDVEYLDNLLYDLLDDSSPINFPKIYIHIGKEDFHYNKHVIPFLNELDKNNITYQLDIEEYKEHNDLAIFYPKYLLKTLNNIENTFYEDNADD